MIPDVTDVMTAVIALGAVALFCRFVTRNWRAAVEYERQWAPEPWKRVPPRRSASYKARERAADALARVRARESVRG